MSFSFNFDVPLNAKSPSEEGSPQDHAIKPETTAGSTPAEPIKEALEHLSPEEPQSLLEDAVFETVTIGTLPPLHFLNESVFESTAPEREDGEKILSRTAAQRSDLISGVYEGGLKVWECTYDLLELVERDGETFGGKRVLDLGCGAGLLGILALMRGAGQVHFQDYNSTVIQQLTLPNVLLNCQEEEDQEEEREEEKRKGKKEEVKGEGNEVRREGKDGSPSPKRRALDPSQYPKLSRCRFFSGDWSTFLPLVLKDDPSPKYDIIFTSETIYNPAYYSALHETLHRLLAKDGLVYLATKAHYFGVGGGLHLFESFVEQRGVFRMLHLWDVEDGLQRHVVALRFRATKTS